VRGEGASNRESCGRGSWRGSHSATGVVGMLTGRIVGGEAGTMVTSPVGGTDGWSSVAGVEIIGVSISYNSSCSSTSGLSVEVGGDSGSGKTVTGGSCVNWSS